MYLIINNNWVLVSMSDTYISMDWCITIEDKNLSYVDIELLKQWWFLKDWKVIEREISNEEKLQNLKQDLEKVTNELVNIKWRIKWAEDLKLAQIFDDDDELELAWYKWRLEELVIERAEIKSKIKEL